MAGVALTGNTCDAHLAVEQQQQAPGLQASLAGASRRRLGPRRLERPLAPLLVHALATIALG